jgi:O-Antigen ligase
MTSTTEAGYSLTSISLPAKVRCSGLSHRSWRGGTATNIALCLAAVCLAFVAALLGAHNIRYGIGFVLCLALVSAVLTWPVVGGLVLIAAVPPLSGLEPGLITPNVRVSEALIGVIGLTVLLGTRRVAAVKWGVLEWVLLAYGLSYAVLAAYDSISLGQTLSFSTWGSVFGQLQFFLLYRTVRVTLRTPKQRRLGLVIVIAVTVPIALLAIMQEAGVGGLRNSLADITGNASPIGTSGIIRATGPFGNWAALAGYFLPILMVLISLGLAGQLQRRKRLCLCLGGLMVIGILLTTELSVIICLIIGIFVLAVQYGRFRKMMVWFGVAAAVSLIVVGPVLGNRLNNQFGAVAGSSKSTLEPQTVSFRQEIWTQQYLPAVAQRPLDGYGLVLPTSISWPYPESQYIEMLIEGGYPLLIMYLVLIWGAFDTARRASRSRDPVEQAIGRSLVIVVVSVLFLGITWPFVSNGGLPQVLWCLYALCGSVGTRFPQPDTAELLPADPAPSRRRRRLLAGHSAG